jgi:DNA polymerase III alpha subunit
MIECRELPVIGLGQSLLNSAERLAPGTLDHSVQAKPIDSASLVGSCMPSRRHSSGPKRRVIRSEELQTIESDRRYKVAGLVLLRQRPSTAKGITFMTLVDETGTTNLIVRVDVWEKFHRIARQAAAMIARGILQRKDGIAHILVDHIEDLSEMLSEIGKQSRDLK